MGSKQFSKAINMSDYYKPSNVNTCVNIVIVLKAYGTHISHLNRSIHSYDWSAVSSVMELYSSDYVVNSAFL